MEEIIVRSKKQNEVIDITDLVKNKINNIKEGVCNLFLLHTTASLILNESADDKIQEDILDAFSRLIPKGVWKHDRLDGNADAHIKSALIGNNSLSIPIIDGKLLLGKWQSVWLLEFDGPRERKIIVKIII